MKRRLCFLVSVIVFLKHAVALPASSHASLRSIELSNYRSRQLNNTSTTTNTDPPSPNEATNPITIAQSNFTSDYPVVTKYEPQEKTEPDKLSIEDLKSKCQHLQKLLNLNRTNENPNRPTNHQYPEMHARPIYINPRPTTRPQYSSTSRPNGFYITAQSPVPVDRRPSHTIQTTPTPIKYIRLEPVILQKTILSDGRMVYYWHKSLPTAVEYPANYTPPAQFLDNPNYQETPQNNAYSYVPANSYVSPQSGYSPYPNGYYYPSYNQNTNGGFVEATTEPTTTTTEASYSYGLSNFIPFYGYASGETTTTATTPEATVSVTPPGPGEKTPEPLLYAQQLRFVIPVPYDGNTEDAQRQQYGFDQYAYYPKQLQPNTLNVRVPYSPTFHMIRAVAVPKVEGDQLRRAEEVQ